MPQGVKEREREQADSKGSQKKPALARSQQWLGLPDSVKRVFDRFPLKSYPANPLPQNILSTRDEHALYIFASSGDARSGRPSYNPGCLKWQVRHSVLLRWPHRRKLIIADLSPIPRNQLQMRIIVQSRLTHGRAAFSTPRSERR